MKREKRIRFSKEEDAYILANWKNAKMRDEMAKKLGRPKNSLAIRYYRIMAKQKNLTPENAFEIEVVKEPEEKVIELETKLIDTDERFYKIETDLKILNEHLAGRENRFKNWLDNMRYFYDVDESILNIPLLVKENGDLKRKNNDLYQKIDDIETAFREEKTNYERVYAELDFWLGQFFKLSNIEKVATLQDFIPQLKMIVDKYGTVLGVMQGNKNG
jgi:hypothetical protein